MFCKKFEILEVVQVANFEVFDWLKNHGTKYLLIFYSSCEDIATTRRCRGLSVAYSNHNLFHQSELGQDIELQRTDILFFEILRLSDISSTLNAQLGLGSELFDGYREATSVSYGPLLIPLTPRTADRLRYCSYCGSVPSKSYSWDRWKYLKPLDDERTKFHYTVSVSIIFPSMRKSFNSVLSEKLYQVFL